MKMRAIVPIILVRADSVKFSTYSTYRLTVSQGVQ